MQISSPLCAYLFTFTPKDGEDMITPYADATIIMAFINNIRVEKGFGG